MTLLCRPPGRGNWRIVVVTVMGIGDLYRFRRNQRFVVGDPALVLRIVEVLP